MCRGQESISARHPECDEAEILLGMVRVLEGDGKRISEDSGGLMKGDPVPLPATGRRSTIPLELYHGTHDLW